MSYLASPPETPISIDGGVEYQYVIAQQGALSMSVDADTDFTFVLTAGEPAVLRLTFTGTVLDTPQYKTVTVNLTQTGGTVVTHTPQFLILPTVGHIQRVPNITSVASKSVAPGQALALQVTATLDAPINPGVIAYSASGLPAGLAINSLTGWLDGTAPSTAGFYVITLTATATPLIIPDGGHYSRYFVLVVGTGITPPGTPPPPAFDATSILFDGDYTQPQIAAMPDYEIPFKTDPRVYSYKIKYWQFIASYSEPALGDADASAFGLGGVFVGLVPGSLKQVGGGVVEFQWEYALVPNTRSEFESFVYSYPIILVGAQGGITEMPITTHSRIQFDYFATDDTSTINLPRAPKAFQLLSTIYLLNGLGEYVCGVTPTGAEVLAQDATLKIWKPGIYERQQRFVRWISILELFANAGC